MGGVYGVWSIRGVEYKGCGVYGCGCMRCKMVGKDVQIALIYSDTVCET
jgi:hypothetical protein